MYVHEPGEEFWFNFFWLPQSLSKTLIPADSVLSDYMIKKDVYIEGSDCQPEWDNSNYAGISVVVVSTTDLKLHAKIFRVHQKLLHL